MKTIVVFIGSLFEYKFFRRFRNSLRSEGYDLIFITSKPSILIQSYTVSIPCFLIQNSKDTIAIEQMRTSTEMVIGDIEEKQAAKYFNGVRECLYKINDNKKIDLFFIWNGNSLPTKAISLFSQTYNIQTLFFELSNIPGKLFVDREGVNAQSSLYRHPEILEEYSSNIMKYDAWRLNYLSLKRKEIVSQHAMNNRRIRNYLFPIDAVGAIVFDLPIVGEMNIFKKIFQVINNNSDTISYSEFNIAKGKYNFFPMQKSDDSQVVLNSKISIHEAILFAMQRSSKQGRALLIKPHPLEKNDEIAAYLVSLKNKKGIFVVNYPTSKIIEYCEEIITINSTVGLEGLIENKKVTFLGISFFPLIKGSLLKNYITGYLLDIDCFSEKELSSEDIQLILKRANI